MRKRMIRRTSRSQPRHGHACGGADGCNGMTFCSSFPPTAVAAPPAGKDRRGDGDASRTRRAKRSGEKREDAKRGMSDESWPGPALQLPLPPSLLLASPSNSALVFPPRSLCKGLDGPRSTGSSSKIRRGGLAVSNEIPSARFQTFTYSRTFSNAGAKRGTRGKDGGIRGRDKNR